MVTDPIGDMVARIRNALMRKKKEVLVPNSRFKRCVLDVFAREGYINAYDQDEKNLVVHLKYFHGASVIQDMKRVSKPSVHIYKGIKDIKPVANGLGTAVISTSKGVLSDREAREQNVGGEVVLTVR